MAGKMARRTRMITMFLQCGRQMSRWPVKSETPEGEARVQPWRKISPVSADPLTLNLLLPVYHSWHGTARKLPAALPACWRATNIEVAVNNPDDHDYYFNNFITY